ncbi:hypothetical protein GpartN1_g6414.t1 [Galdieria partita]|uniref:Maf-like protein n=1 Tax=Galdieria partita TaxID=83374 RepID=A0A9C7Q199_9RHOD|nr:hypothetical protein GpartN1_g6414.t1 [Galdieria partita]
MSFHLILGSSSPSRQALLKQWGYEFETEPADIDEKSIRAETAEELVQKLALAKSEAILARRTRFEDQKPTLLVTADQVVVHEGRILEKPKDAKEAHEFISGYSCSPAVTVGAIVVTNCQSHRRECGLDRSEIYFRPIPDSVIQQLVEEGSVYYCAGGLQVENPLVSKFVDHIVGTLDSVMGLSRQVLEDLIEKVISGQSLKV